MNAGEALIPQQVAQPEPSINYLAEQSYAEQLQIKQSQIVCDQFLCLKLDMNNGSDKEKYCKNREKLLLSRKHKSENMI